MAVSKTITIDDDNAVVNIDLNGYTLTGEGVESRSCAQNLPAAQATRG